MLSLLLIAQIGLGQPPVTSKPVPTYGEIFAAAWTTLNDNFYDPSFSGVDWPAMRRKYEPQVAKVKSDTEFVELIYRMLGELHVSHLGIRPPQRPRAFIGVETWTIAGERVVVTVAPSSDARVQGVRIGDRLVTKDGDIAGPLGSRASVRVEGCDGKTRDVSVARENAFWPPEYPSLRWRQIETAPGRTIGYIKAVRFDDDAAPLADAAMKDLGDTSGLIIDLRDNSGGNLSSLRLGSYILKGPILAAVLLGRSYLDKLGNAPEHLDVSRFAHVTGAYTTDVIINAFKQNGGGAAFYTEDVGDKRYKRPVVVLINEESGSASEGFAWVLKGKPNITLVGRSTAGALLGSERFDLPGGWILTLPTHAAWGADGTRYVDRSVSPDVNVTWTPRDVCDGRDPDMAKALELLKRN